MVWLICLTRFIKTNYVKLPRDISDHCQRRSFGKSKRKFSFTVTLAVPFLFNTERYRQEIIMAIKLTIEAIPLAQSTINLIRCLTVGGERNYYLFTLQLQHVFLLLMLSQNSHFIVTTRGLYWAFQGGRHVSKVVLRVSQSCKPKALILMAETVFG